MRATAFLQERIRILLRPVCCLALLTLAAGCGNLHEQSFTYKLWTSESFTHFNEPAADPRLKLFVDRSRSDVLVEYDEVRERDGAINRRAFYVNSNVQRIESGQKPRFVNPKISSKLEPVHVLQAGSGDSVPQTGFCVVLDPNQQQFKMYSDGKLSNEVTLPAYGTTGGIKKTLLTPITVTGDTLVVGVAAGILVAYAWAHSGYYGAACH